LLLCEHGKSPFQWARLNTTPLYSSLSMGVEKKFPPFIKKSLFLFLKVLKRLPEDLFFENLKSKNNSVLINEGE